MVILLSGSSRTARLTIAEQAVEKHPVWKHLALEVIAEAMPQSGEGKDFHLKVIKKCAQELAKENMHLMLTMPEDAPQRALLALSLKPDCITVNLGEENDGTYDYAIDTAARSVSDVTAFLDTLMEEP